MYTTGKEVADAVITPTKNLYLLRFRMFYQSAQGFLHGPHLPVSTPSRNRRFSNLVPSRTSRPQSHTRLSDTRINDNINVSWVKFFGPTYPDLTL